MSKNMYGVGGELGVEVRDQVGRRGECVCTECVSGHDDAVFILEREDTCTSYDRLSAVVHDLI